MVSQYLYNALFSAGQYGDLAAALNSAFVASALAPLYDGAVFYAKDAFDAIKIMEKGASESSFIPSERDECSATSTLTIQHDYVRLSKPFCNKEKTVSLFFHDIEPFINKERLFKVKWNEHDRNEALKLYNSYVR